MHWPRVEIGRPDEILLEEVHCVHFRPKETEWRHNAIQNERQGQEGGLMKSIEGNVVSGQEGHPDDQGGCHWDEDVPTLIEVVGKFSSEEPKDCRE